MLEDLRWANLELPRLALEEGADLLHHPLPALAMRAPCPQVVTIHDLAFERLPDSFDARFRAAARHGHRRAARGAHAVVCVSQTTARDVQALWGVQAERIVVAPHGPGQEPAGDRPKRERTHLLYVGDAEPRKNVALLLAAYAAYRDRAAEPLGLILAGGGLERELAAAGSPFGVEVVARPGPARLAELYASAALLVHPSLHEGFGLTVLEAMSAGLPVLAGRSPGVVEVCDDAASFFDPRSTGSLAGALAELTHDEPALRDLAERGRRRAGEFSWRRSARLHVEAYTLALEGAPHVRTGPTT